MNASQPGAEVLLCDLGRVPEQDNLTAVFLPSPLHNMITRRIVVCKLLGYGRISLIVVIIPMRL